EGCGIPIDPVGGEGPLARGPPGGERSGHAADQRPEPVRHHLVRRGGVDACGFRGRTLTRSHAGSGRASGPEADVDRLEIADRLFRGLYQRASEVEGPATGAEAFGTAGPAELRSWSGRCRHGSRLATG